MANGPVLHLGVQDIPYTANPANAKPPRARKARQGKQRPRRSRPATPNTTTGDVAEILEAKYGLFSTFVEHHEANIMQAVAESARDVLEARLMGAPATIDAFGAAVSKIEKMMKDWVSTQEVESVGIPGVPTKAALDGINHRLKSKRGERRPSFIDTGLLEASFKSWVTGS